jgi:hypothetical protein
MNDVKKILLALGLLFLLAQLITVFLVGDKRNLGWILTFNAHNGKFSPK